LRVNRRLLHDEEFAERIEAVLLRGELRDEAIRHLRVGGCSLDGILHPRLYSRVEFVASK
jgi:hypothetical protein